MSRLGHGLASAAVAALPLVAFVHAAAAQSAGPVRRFMPEWVQTGDPGPVRAFALSGVLPGSGQWVMGSERWIPYLVAEAWAWTALIDRAAERERLERRYRDLAWSVARRISTGGRREGDFEYYEAMARFAASGAYDVDATLPGVQPESDESTFNGNLWALARDLYVPADSTVAPGSPPYDRALSWYRERAIRPTFAWSWGDSGLQQQVFRELIDESDAAARSATVVLGVILANHVVSAVDGLIAARLRSRPGPEGDGVDVGSFRLRGALVPAGGSVYWVQSVEIALPKR